MSTTSERLNIPWSCACPAGGLLWSAGAGDGGRVMFLALLTLCLDCVCEPRASVYRACWSKEELRLRVASDGSSSVRRSLSRVRRRGGPDLGQLNHVREERLRAGCLCSHSLTWSIGWFDFGLTRIKSNHYRARSWNMGRGSVPALLSPSSIKATIAWLFDCQFIYPI